MGKITIGSIIIGSLILVGMASCGGGRGVDEIQSQAYTNGLTALFSDTGKLTGRVVFPSEYSQHSIRFSLGPLTFVTHPDGRFLVARIPTGTHRFIVLMQGYEPIHRTVTIAEGKTTQLQQMALKQARGLVFGRLVNQYGQQAGGIRVQLDPLGGVNLSDPQGFFRFDGVEAGNHLLRINDSRFSPNVKHFVMEANQRLNLGVITVVRLPGSGGKTAKLDQ